MQPLHTFNNVQKAKLLHALFVNQIPGFLTYTQELSAFIKANPDAVRKVWKNQLFGIDFWFQLSEEADQKIKRYGKQLEKSSNLFADYANGRQRKGRRKGTSPPVYQGG